MQPSKRESMRLRSIIARRCLAFFLLWLLFPLSAAALVYPVGPGQTHADLSSIDWPNLQAGDEVRIHWREQPYRSKIGLRSRGSAQAPIRLLGVSGPQGQRPIISGDGATTPPSLRGFFSRQYTESLGVIVIHRGPDDDWGDKPGYIQIEGLAIRGGHPDYRYTGMDGAEYRYFDGAAGIWAVLVEHLEVRDCEISDNGNGFFVLSKNSDEAETSRDVLVEGNHIHGNGIVGSDQEHNIYTQVSGITFQYNRIGRLRAGSGGIALKDRSANTVIRYNWIESGARTLDLVEPEDSYGIMLAEPGFSDTWVYGNIILNEYSATHPYAVNMFHYGGDIGDPSIYRKGTLHFFHNTVFMRLSQPETWSVNLFDLSTNDESVALRNNIFYREGNAELYLARDAGNLTLAANNWISDGWRLSVADNEWHTFIGALNLEAEPLSGDDPGFFDPEAGDFSLSSGSPALDMATELPASLALSHPLTMQYRAHQQGQGRELLGLAFDLGALERVAQSDPMAELGVRNGQSLFALNEQLPLTLSFSSGSHDGERADWWLVRQDHASNVLHYFDLQTLRFAAEARPSARDALFSFDEFLVASSADRAGDFTYYFGVDLIPNGQLDLAPGQVFYDTLNIRVSAPEEPSAQASITYVYADSLYRIAARAGAAPENISQQLDAFSSGKDALINISPNGEWLVFISERLRSDCMGWACLMVADADLETLQLVAPNDAPIHPESGIAIASSGETVIFAATDGPHEIDLWVSHLRDGQWRAPALLSAASPYAYNNLPAISDDGQSLLFECGDEPYARHSVCEVGIDGQNLRTRIQSSAALSGARTPDYAPDGGIVTELDQAGGAGETIFRLQDPDAGPVPVNSQFTNDNSPCVLPDGRIASLWLNRPGSTGVHELKLMNADGGGELMLITGQDILDANLGCGGGP